MITDIPRLLVQVKYRILQMEFNMMLVAIFRPLDKFGACSRAERFELLLPIVSPYIYIYIYISGTAPPSNSLY